MADVECLYKYTSFDAACQILSSQQLKWSYPADFNDPLDCSAIIHNFSFENYAKAFERIFKKELFSRRPSRIPPESEQYQHVLGFRLLSNKKKREQYEDMNVYNVAKKQFVLYEKKLSGFWELMRTKQLVVICFTSDNKSMYMWTKYAEQHKGIMFEFTRKNDQGLVASAKEVVYQNDLVVFSSSPEEVVEETLCIRNFDERHKGEAEKAIYTKGLAWKEECEWRCIDKNNDDNRVEIDGNFCELRRFDLNELKSVYFGHGVSKEKQERLVSLLMSNSNHVNLYVSKMDKNNQLVYIPL